MHIVLYSPAWPPEGNPNGIVTYCAQLKPGFERQNHEVNILCGTTGVEKARDLSLVEYDLNIIEKIFLRVVSFFRPSFRTYYIGSRGIVKVLKKLDKQKKIDVFEIEESFGFHYYIQKKCKFPVVMRLHGPHIVNGVFDKIITPRISDRVKIEKKAFLAAKYVTSPSQYVLDRVLNEYAPTWKRSSVIPNPIEQVQESMRWCSDSYVENQVLFVGRFDKHKGGDVVVRAFAEVLKEIPSAKLIFAGPDRGMNINGKKVFINEFVNSVLPENKMGSIEYLGLQNKEQILELRKRSNVTVCASRDENFGYVALEALASSTPFICSAVGGNVEIVKDGINGVHFDSEDYVGLGKAICELLDNKEKACSLAEAAQKSCSERYAVEKIVNDTLCFYKEIQGIN